MKALLTIAAPGWLILVGVKSMRILIILLTLCVSASAAWAQSLKPGDTLNISVLQDPKLDRTVIVDSGGQIAFPLAGHIQAEGLSPQALEQLLKSKLQKNYKDESLDVTVALGSITTPEEDLKPKIYV